MTTRAPVRCLHEVVELDRDCELGLEGERAVVIAIDSRYMQLVFPNRPWNRRHVSTGADYAYLRSV